MSKVHSTAVVIIPSQKTWDTIQDIRKKYDRHIQRWMPHITLLYPFKPQSEFNKLESSFSTICNKIELFEMTFNNFNYFNQGKQKYTIWLAPEPKYPVVSLQNKLLEIVPGCNDVHMYKKGFIPHLSVGQIKGKDNLEALLKNLRSNWSPLNFKITSVYFIAREKQKLSEFKIKKEISLK